MYNAELRVDVRTAAMMMDKIAFVWIAEGRPQHASRRIRDVGYAWSLSSVTAKIEQLKGSSERVVIDGSGHRDDGCLSGITGGARRDRTADLVIANDALSQLSYGPVHGRNDATTGNAAIYSPRQWQVKNGWNRCFGPYFHGLPLFGGNRNDILAGSCFRMRSPLPSLRHPRANFEFQGTRETDNPSVVSIRKLS